ncbi:MAG: PIG-L family deacetylase [Alphaproteobacteria bacterium]|nr:PIG-L family deacetylase [Alphaproteobacteria bacterium]
MSRKAYKWVLRAVLEADDLHDLSVAVNSMRTATLLRPQFMAGPRGKRVIVLAPHPDDESIGLGGTLLQTASRGAKIEIVFLTSGSLEQRDEREQEALSVCKVLGCSATFLREEEGSINPVVAGRALQQLIDTSPVQTVFVPFLSDDHRDHRKANEVLLYAMRQSGAVAYEVWAYQVYSALPGNVAVDVTPVVEAKAALVRLYDSQMKRRDWVHFALGLNAFNSRFGVDPSQRYVESFFVVPGGEYLGLLERYYDTGASREL